MNKQADGLKKMFPKTMDAPLGVENVPGGITRNQLDLLFIRSDELKRRGIVVRIDEGGLIRMNNYVCVCRDVVDILCLMGGFLLGMKATEEKR
jgi:hypothetical protein